MQTYIIIVPFLRLGHFLINHIIWYRYWYCNTHFNHVCINWPWPNLHVRLCKYYFCWKYLLCTFKIIFFNGSSAASVTCLIQLSLNFFFSICCTGSFGKSTCTWKCDITRRTSCLFNSSSVRRWSKSLLNQWANVRTL